MFRYPGIRSDSDMYTLGFTHKPWTKPHPIAPGAQIRNYIKGTAREFDIDKHISYQKELLSASYCSDKRQWTLKIRDHSEDNKIISIRCNFLEMCSGYYDYENPYRPKFEGEENFKGETIHPQMWKEGFDYSDKKVVIIGSGATAVTLLPNLTDNAKHVTMLQRSPTYILSLPQHNRLTVFLQRVLPSHWAYRIIRWQNILLSWLLFVVCRTFPGFAKKKLVNNMKKSLPRFVHIVEPQSNANILVLVDLTMKNTFVQSITLGSNGSVLHQMLTSSSQSVLEKHLWLLTILKSL